MSSEQLTEELPQQRVTSEVAPAEAVENKPEAAPQAFGSNSNTLNRKIAQAGQGLGLAQALGSNSNSLRRKIAQGASTGPTTSLKRSPLGSAADLGGPLTVSEEERKNAFGIAGSVNPFEVGDAFQRPVQYGVAKGTTLPAYTATDAAPVKGLMDQISPASQPPNPTVTNTTEVTATQGKNPYSFSKKATFGAQGVQFQDYNPAPIDSVGVTNTTNVAGTIPGLPGSNFKLTGTLNLAGANLSDEVKRQLSLGGKITGHITLFQVQSAGAINDGKTKVGTYSITIQGPTGDFEISDTETFTNPDPKKHQDSVTHTSTSSSKGSYNLLHLTGSAHYDPTGSLLDVDLNVGEGGKITGKAHAIAAHFETKGTIGSDPAHPDGDYSVGGTFGDVTGTVPETGPATLSGNLVDFKGNVNYKPTGSSANASATVGVDGKTNVHFSATSFHTEGSGQFDQGKGKVDYALTGPTLDILSNLNSTTVKYTIAQASGDLSYAPTGTSVAATLTIGENFATTGEMKLTLLDKTFTIVGDPKGLHLDGGVKVLQTTATLTPNGMSIHIDPIEAGLTLKNGGNTLGSLTANSQGVKLQIGISF